MGMSVPVMSLFQIFSFIKELREGGREGDYLGQGVWKGEGGARYTVCYDMLCYDMIIFGKPGTYILAAWALVSAAPGLKPLKRVPCQEYGIIGKMAFVGFMQERGGLGMSLHVMWLVSGGFFFRLACF